MSKWLNPAKEQILLSTKCTSAVFKREPAEQKIQNFPDNDGEMIQYIHFTRNKSGYLE